MNLRWQITDPRVLVNPPSSELGVRNAIVAGRARQYHFGEFPGPLSIKSVLRGTARWETREAQRLVDETNYLILNDGQPYSLTIDSREQVETFCLFFRKGLVEEVRRVESTAPTALLDDPAQRSLAGGATGSVEFFETLHPQDSIVSPILQKVYSRMATNTATQLWLEDQFWAAASAVCYIQTEGAQQAARIPARREATRLELYRRLLRGRDYMDSFFDRDLRLAEVAREASLSPYHFHRLFRGAFGETPNRYLQRKRLVSAQRLLDRGAQSVTDICLEVGFESVTSFSGLFRRRFGCSPREYCSSRTKARRA